MKSAHDPRHQKRRDLVKELFAGSFAEQSLSQAAQDILSRAPQFDAQIAAAAPQWPVDKLNKIDLAILRLATYELSLGETPPKVVIDEAVELAKEYGAESSPSFVNGVLGTILSNTNKEEINNEGSSN